MIEEYERLDGLAIAELVRKGDVTALEVLETAIERIDARATQPHLSPVGAVGSHQDVEQRGLSRAGGRREHEQRAGRRPAVFRLRQIRHRHQPYSTF